MRCWSCGASERMRKDCLVANVAKPNPDRKPKAAKVAVDEELKQEVMAEGNREATPRAATTTAAAKEDSPEWRARHQARRRMGP